MRILPNKLLNEIFIKAMKDSEKSDICLYENNLKLLITEQLKDADIAAVRKSIADATTQVDEISKYLSTINIDKAKLGGIETTIAGLKSALSTAGAELAGLNIKSFGSSKLTNFFGQKVTLPQVTQAAIALHTKAQDFGAGFNKAISIVVDNLSPLVTKDEDKDTPISDLAGTEGYPDEDSLRSSLEKGMKKAFGGGFFKKIASFFGKAMSGAEKKIMASLPKIDPDELASGLAAAIMSTSLNDLSTPLPNIEVDNSEMSNVAQSAQESEDSATPGQGTEDSSEASAPEEPVSDKEADDLQQQSEEELKQAVKDAAQSDDSPGVAMAGAVEDWVDDLPKSSKQTIKSKNRDEELKDSIKSTADELAATLSSAVTDAVNNWRGKHEEALLKSKRFSKKNLDSLSDLIPKLAQHLLKQSNESNNRLTINYIDRFINRALDRWTKQDNILSEALFSRDHIPKKGKKGKNKISEYTDVDRWMKLAGLNKND